MSTDGRLFVFSAPSGAGKTSLVRALLEQERGLTFSVSCTTRAPRSGEVDGVDYRFLDAEDFRRRVEGGEFLEHAEVFGNLYGTLRSDVRAEMDAGRDVLLEIDWQGAEQVRAAMPGAISVFILPPSRAELETRLKGRGTDAPEVIERRLAAGREEIEHWRSFDHVVVNDDFDRALGQLVAITRGERPPGAPEGIEDLVRELTR